MNRALRALAVLALAGGAGTQDPPTIAVLLLGAAAGGEIEFGVPFDLRVTRTWPAGQTPEPWTDAALAPLVVAAGRVQHEAQAGRVQETREFRAWAFRRGAVTLQPQIVLPAAGGGAAQRATAELRAAFVQSSLPESDDGTAELPDPPELAFWPVRRELARAALVATAAGVVIWLLGFVIRAARARGPVPDARALARSRIDALRRAAPESRAQRRAEAVAITAIARAQLQGESSTELHTQLAAILNRVDAVKFAADELAPDERESLLDGLATCVAAAAQGRTDVAS